MHSPESPESPDPHDDEFDPSQINVIESMSDELWALFVQGLAPKGAAPPPGVGADATAPAPQGPAKLADICIRAASGNVFKFRPATALMDKALLAAAIEATIAEREAATRWDADHGAQRAWDLYCEWNRDKYGREYFPDTEPFWEKAREGILGTHARASSGARVDFKRASLLMDKALLESTLEAMRAERNRAPGWDFFYDVQWAWEFYRARHYEKYGQHFVPDVDRRWDRPQRPADGSRSADSNHGPPAPNAAVQKPKR